MGCVPVPWDGSALGREACPAGVCGQRPLAMLKSLSAGVKCSWPMLLLTGGVAGSDFSGQGEGIK